MRLALPDESATARLARALAGCLSERDLVLLAGDLGAGKTTFVQHAAAALGCLEPVRSPTYTVAHQYELPGGATLAHLDLYRQAGDMLGAEAWGDIEPYFDSFAAFVEWPAVAAVQLAGRRTWPHRPRPALADDARRPGNRPRPQRGVAAARQVARLLLTRRAADR